MNKLLLSGFKTWIGLVLIGVGSIMDAVGIAGGDTVTMYGGMLAGIGGFHKVLKESGAVGE